MPLERAQRPIQQQFGDQVVEAADHHAKLHAGAHQIALKCLCCRAHRHDSSGAAGGSRGAHALPPGSSWGQGRAEVSAMSAGDHHVSMEEKILLQPPMREQDAWLG